MTALTADSKIAEALAALSLEEKVQLLTGRDFWTTWPIEKIGLRRILVSDGPSGVRGETWDERDPSLNLPSATALASSWDPDIARRYGAAAAVEARRKGVDVVLGPTINLHRSPLGGRHFEAFSEDPVLTADLAAAYVTGVQDNGVGATPKHYVANDSETDRFTVDVRVSDRALRELYLLAFEKAVTDAHAWLVMSSYNSVNGTTATENDLLETPLNSEWGFDGVVISDWTAVRSLESAKASQDLVMPGPDGPWGEALVRAVRSGEIPEAVVDRKVARILTLARRVGALDGFPAAEPAWVEDGIAFARHAAIEGTVLLENRGELPWDPARLRSVAVIGDNAANARTQGGGSATVVPEYTVSPLAGLRAALPGVDVTYSRGAVVQEGVVELPLAQMTNPVTGGPGLRARFLDSGGTELFAEDRRSSALVWFGGDAPIGRSATVELATRFTPAESGPVRVGFATVGHGKVYVDGELVVDEITESEHADLGAALMAPPTAAAEVNLTAGTPAELRFEYDLAGRTGPMAELLWLRFGTEPAVVDSDALIAAAAEAAAQGGRRAGRRGHQLRGGVRGLRPHLTRAARPPGRPGPRRRRRQPAHRRAGERGVPRADALARSSLGGARRLLRRAGIRPRRRRHAARRGRAGRPAAHHLAGGRGRRAGHVHHADGRRAGLRRRDPHRLPGLARTRRRAGVLVRQRPRLHRHRPGRRPRACLGHRRGSPPRDRRGREPRRARRQADRADLRGARGLRDRPPGALAGRLRARAGTRRGEGTGAPQRADPAAGLLAGRLALRARCLPAPGRHLRRRPAAGREGGAHMRFPNPLIPGFNPDPSVVAADGAYYLVTSTFEYLPGIPVYRSTDLVTWTHIGNVATRPEQVSVEDVATGGGVWAPTIRYREGIFYVIVTIAMSPRGCVVFTATDPAGPWSDGITIDGVGGIDPDLAWDDDGTAYVTFSGLSTSGEQMGQHLGIQQVRVDLTAGKALEAPRSLWSGTGLKFPEAPHLYRRGGHWYLLIAEGGTERGHSVSVARGPSPEGPFTGHPANPVLSACGTSRPIQNTGHADLVATPDGGTALVLLGMRPLGLTQSFSPLGRETFITPVSWADGWPQPDPVRLAPRDAVDEEVFDFADPAALEDPGWLAVRTTPESVASVRGRPAGDHRPDRAGRPAARSSSAAASGT